MNKILLYIVIILICILYIYYYTKYNPEFNIIQTYIDEINLKLLFEKSPIVIYDKIYNPEDLLKTLFKYTYISKKQSVITPIIATRNTAKYLILWNQDNDLDIDIIHPKYYKEIKKKTETTYVTIKLKSNQILILPAFWLYKSQSSVNIIELNDLISYFLSK